MKSATDNGTEKRKGASGQGPRQKTNNNPLAKDMSGLKSARAMNNSTSNIKGSMKQDAQTADKVRAGAQDDLERLSQSSFNKKKAAPRTLKPIKEVDPYAKPLVEGQTALPPRKPGLSG